MKIFGQHDENTLRQLQDVASRAERVALMADGHVGYIMPIGGVAAYLYQRTAYHRAIGEPVAPLSISLPVLGGTAEEEA